MPNTISIELSPPSARVPILAPAPTSLSQLPRDVLFQIPLYLNESDAAVLAATSRENRDLIASHIEQRALLSLGVPTTNLRMLIRDQRLRECINFGHLVELIRKVDRLTPHFPSGLSPSLRAKNLSLLDLCYLSGSSEAIAYAESMAAASVSSQQKLRRLSLLLLSGKKNCLQGDRVSLNELNFGKLKTLLIYAELGGSVVNVLEVLGHLAHREAPPELRAPYNARVEYLTRLSLYGVYMGIPLVISIVVFIGALILNSFALASVGLAAVSSLVPMLVSILCAVTVLSIIDAMIARRGERIYELVFRFFVPDERQMRIDSMLGSTPDVLRAAAASANQELLKFVLSKRKGNINNFLAEFLLGAALSGNIVIMKRAYEMARQKSFCFINRPPHPSVLACVLNGRNIADCAQSSGKIEAVALAASWGIHPSILTTENQAPAAPEAITRERSPSELFQVQRQQAREQSAAYLNRHRGAAASLADGDNISAVDTPRALRA